MKSGLLGAAASYTYGDGKLTNGGKDDNWIASGSIYALGAFDDGSYLDVVLRASRIHIMISLLSVIRQGTSLKVNAPAMLILLPLNMDKRFL